MRVTAMVEQQNVDAEELRKFDELARRWWDPKGEFRTLHDINPLRLGYITQRVPLAGKRVLDLGCGGGLLTEAMAKEGAQVIGVDAAEGPLAVARLHRHESGVQVDYQQTTAEDLAAKADMEAFDVITCLEMLEHVPSPGSVIRACASMLKPDGYLFLSTINRNPKSYLFAILGAEYLLKLLPRGTHDYERLIKPSEMAGWCRQAGLRMADLTGMTYNPVTRTYRLGRDLSVNYLALARPASAA